MTIYLNSFYIQVSLEIHRKVLMFVGEMPILQKTYKYIQTPTKILYKMYTYISNRK